ncbi:uncharacterized protein LOC135370424 [Ornithodoros turicata]|uniref:uncharacterized protein LOC135370424 n=1 Tax=Ornithodoros turicata TaxID=34597 RepID=UPI00313945B3
MTGLLKSSSATTLQCPPPKAEELLQPYFNDLQKKPVPAPPGLKASTISLIGGYLVKAVENRMKCAGCLVRLKSEASDRPTVAIINNLDRVGLSYPSLEFVGFLLKLEEAASTVRSTLLQMQKPLYWFVNRLALVHDSLLTYGELNHPDGRTIFRVGTTRAYERKTAADHRSVQETEGTAPVIVRIPALRRRPTTSSNMEQLRGKLVGALPAAAVGATVTRKQC